MICQDISLENAMFNSNSSANYELLDAARSPVKNCLKGLSEEINASLKFATDSVGAVSKDSSYI